VALLKESGESDQIPAVEKNRDERVERLCALAFQTAADKQAAATILEGARVKEDRAATILEGARVKEDRAAAIKQETAAKEQETAAHRQAAATYREMGDVLQKLEKNPSSRVDLDRLPILYAKAAALATEDEKKNALPVLANVMRKLGVKVPGD
jgi:hypothetical protein